MTGRSVLLHRIAVLHGGKLRMNGWFRCYIPVPLNFAISNLLTIIGNIHLLANNLRVSVRWSRVAAARQVLMWPALGWRSVTTCCLLFELGVIQVSFTSERS